jgi:hypothetical protein
VSENKIWVQPPTVDGDGPHRFAPESRWKLGELLILTTTKFVETCFVSWCICASMNLA